MQYTIRNFSPFMKQKLKVSFFGKLLGRRNGSSTTKTPMMLDLQQVYRNKHMLMNVIFDFI